MQVVRTLQRAWRDRETTERTSVHPGLTGSVSWATGYWSILLSQPPTERPLQRRAPIQIGESTRRPYQPTLGRRIEYLQVSGLSRQFRQPETVSRQPPFSEVGHAEQQSLLRGLHVPG
jgi:hypothetical protein